MEVFEENFIYARKFIDIFFYRGDSQGEGGSNFYWLNTKNFNLIINQFKPNAVLISDLSNHDETVYDLLNKEIPVNYNNKIINPKKELEKRYTGTTYSWENIFSAR